MNTVVRPHFSGILDQYASPILAARSRSLFEVDAVKARLARIHPWEHESLKRRYDDMIARWPDRFDVKPTRMPHFDEFSEEVPNFQEVIMEIRRRLALTIDSKDSLELEPILLLGPPGIGKTHFVREIAELIGTGYWFITMSSLSAGWVLSGASSQWKGARPGKVFETLVDGEYINPVMVIDEIDKARGGHAYDPLGALYSLLEHDTAERFIDEFADVPIDASRMIWFATANDERSIPDPILSRMYAFNIWLTREHARVIAERLYKKLIKQYDWGKKFEREPLGDALDVLSQTAPREMRRALRTAFGNAALDKRWKIEVADLPKSQSWKKWLLGFIN